jgi:translation initiation factor 1
VSRGKKLELNLGAHFDESWSEVAEKKEKKITDILEPNKHFLVFKREKRRGKVVTLVGEFHLNKDDSSTLLKDLKKSLGCGGTLKDNFMEFQGGLQIKLKPALEAKGFRFKR